MAEAVETSAQNQPIGAGVYGELVLVVADQEADAVASEEEPARLQLAAVVVGQHRDQDRVFELRLWRAPVDVEVGCVPAGSAVLQHVPPPAVVAAGNGHVVGDDIQQLAEAIHAKAVAEPGVSLLAPQLGVDARGVDHVVAVAAARRCLQVGGAVEMADTEPGQVVGDGRGFVEAEARVELEAVCGPQAGTGRVDLLTLPSPGKRRFPETRGSAENAEFAEPRLRDLRFARNLQKPGLIRPSGGAPTTAPPPARGPPPGSTGAAGRPCRAPASSAGRTDRAEA